MLVEVETDNAYSGLLAEGIWDMPDSTIERPRSRAAEFVREYTADWHPEIGARRRYEYEAGSPFALDAMRTLASTRRGSPRLIETYPHSPMEAPLRRMQYHGVYRFNDGSQVAVYDQAMVVAHKPEDVIRISASQRGPIFGGAWDGLQLNDLLLTIRDIAGRFGITADREPLMLDVAKTLTIPHQDPDYLKAHPYNAIAPVMAVDKFGGALLQHPAGLIPVPAQEPELGRAKAQNILQARRMADIAPVAEELSIYSQIDAIYKSARKIYEDAQQSIRDSLGPRIDGASEPSAG